MENNDVNDENPYEDEDVDQQMYDDYDYDEEDEEEEDEEDERQTIKEMGAHPRMQRIQQALLKQLQDNNERVSLELREKEEEARRLTAKREEVGVALYGVQQQLSKLQMSLESTHAKYNDCNETRFKAEEDLDDFKEQLTALKEKDQDDHRQLRDNQAELDSINATLRQVETYSEEIRSQIEINRRAAYKAEENVANLEKGKKKQDLYIDNLTAQIKQLKEEIKLNASQIDSQGEETQQALETLNEAAKEMEKINFEKKQLLQQWKSSLIGMQRRDEALQATQKSIQEVQEAILSTRSETQGYKQSIAAAQSQNETLTATADRIDAEIKYVEEQVQTMLQEKERLSERYTMLQKSMQQTDVQAGRVGLETKAIQSEVTQTLQKLESVRRERHRLEDEIDSQRNSQTTVNKAAHNLTKESRRIQMTIHEKEMAMANMKNELARIKVDTLNTTAHNLQLRETLNKLVHDLQEKDTQVERMELEIRQRNDEIEKKMLRVDRLNKKYEQLVSNMEDENTGPLEATIKNIQKETLRIQGENAEKQREWLTIQTTLVTCSAETEQTNEKNQELKSKQSILEQKRLRLLKNIDHMKKEVKELDTGIAQMHNDMTKLNTLIAKNATQSEKLANMNFGIEQAFVQELKLMEEESSKLQSQIATIKDEKKQLLDEIVEVERQIMLWEKKIQLEKETQEALDPEVGQQEAKSMENEIHRMQIRLETLTRDQERMLVEMERAVAKREAIAVRGRVQKGTEVTQASMTKQISSLQNSCRKNQRETTKYEIAIKEKMDAIESNGFDLENLTNEYAVQEEKAAELQKQVNDALYEKQRLADVVSRTQRLVKRYDQLQAGAIPLIEASDTVKIEKDFAHSRENLQRVQSIIQRLEQDHPHLDEVLHRVLLLTESP